jgi:hypothetical protein
VHTCKQCGQAMMASFDEQTFIQFHERRYIQQAPMKQFPGDLNAIQPLRVADVDAGEFCSRNCLKDYLTAPVVPDVDPDDIPF